MLVRILEEAGERIPKRNYVYVIRTRASKTGEVSGKDGKGEDDADVENERGKEHLCFVGGSQASERIQEDWRQKTGLSSFPFVIREFNSEVQ